jgi:hypothetical protein
MREEMAALVGGGVAPLQTEKKSGCHAHQQSLVAVLDRNAQEQQE